MSVDGLTLDQAIAKVRGKKGTPVVLTIVRAGQAPFDLRIVRDTIVQSQVETRDLANDSVRYIRVSAFSDNSAKDFTDALRAGLEKGERSVIVDLRDNPGGYVTAARTMASQFIASGPVYWEESADGTQIETDASPGGVATDPAIRVIVLVNKGSASASEIVSGALQDTKRGTLVGETTYGKGTIQQWVDLTDNSGGFRLTIAKWLTPAKRWIHQKGLTPDVVIATGGATTKPTGDPYIDAALKALGAPAATVELAPGSLSPGPDAGIGWATGSRPPTSGAPQSTPRPAATVRALDHSITDTYHQTRPSLSSRTSFSRPAWRFR